MPFSSPVYGTFQFRFHQTRIGKLGQNEKRNFHYFLHSSFANCCLVWMGLWLACGFPFSLEKSCFARRHWCWCYVLCFVVSCEPCQDRMLSVGLLRHIFWRRCRRLSWTAPPPAPNVWLRGLNAGTAPLLNANSDLIFLTNGITTFYYSI